MTLTADLSSALLEWPRFAVRQDQLDQLEQLFHAVEAGGSHAAVVLGEMGMGKSRLLAELSHEARERGWITLAGRSDPLESGIPYAAFRFAMLDLLNEAPRSVRPMIKSVLEAIEPVAGDSLGARPLFAEAYRKSAACFEALTEHRPTLFAFDDLQAADADTVALLVTLVARRLIKTPFLLGVAIRTQESGSELVAEQLHERLDPDGRITSLELLPLRPEEIQRLLEDGLGFPDPSEALVTRVAHRSAGNLFFAIEEVRALLRGGHLVTTGGHTRLSGADVPPLDAGRTAILRRIGSLGEDALSVATALSMLSRVTVWHLDLVTDLLGVSAQCVAQGFDTLVEAHVLRPNADGGYEFSHPIVGETLYASMGVAERTRRHRLLSERLRAQLEAASRRRADFLEVARHVAASALPGDADAADLLVEAGDLVIGKAPKTAADWYQRAAELLAETAPQRGFILAKVARALFWASQSAEACTVGERALESLPQGPERKQCAVLVADALSKGGDFERALEVLDGELGDEEQSHPRVLMMRSMALQQLRRAQDAAVAARQALETSPEHTNDHALALFQLAQLAAHHGRVEEVRQRVAEQLSFAHELSLGAQVNLYGWAAYHFVCEGIIDEGRELLAQAEAGITDLPSVALRGPIDTARVLLDWHAGDWDAVVRHTESLSQDVRQGERLVHHAQHAAIVAHVFVNRGELRLAQSALALAQEPRLLIAAQYAQVAQASLLRAEGAPDRAAALLAQALCLDPGGDSDDGWGPYGFMLASEYLQLDAATHTVPVEGLVARLEDEARRRPLARVEWLLARARLFGDIDAGRECRDLTEPLGLVFAHGRALVALGTAGDRPAEHLSRALEVFWDLEAEPWRLQVGSVMRDLGLTVPRRRGRKTEHGLTDSERQIMRLVAQGMTNRQIAHAVSYSEKTVEAYLTKIYRKTNCRSRLELAMLEEQAGHSA